MPPMKAAPRLPASLAAVVMSAVAAVRSALMRGATLPSRCPTRPARFVPKQTRDTLTAAPSTTHGSSDHASKTTLSATIRSSTVRFRPPRIELVATRPARAILLSATSLPALWNQ